MADAGVVAARPSQRYAEGVAREDWSDDPAQRAVLRELDRIHDALADAPRSGLLDRLFGRDGGKTTDGLYLWGGVGRGKTFLIDLFYAGLPLPESKPGRGVRNGKQIGRAHRFLRGVHEQIGRAHVCTPVPNAPLVCRL